MSKRAKSVNIDNKMWRDFRKKALDYGLSASNIARKLIDKFNKGEIEV